MKVIISIIVPVYNVESYLPMCIDSILSQTFKDFELILIDDGSTDESGKICDKYIKKDPRIKVIHQRNQGLSAARNSGIEIAKGDFITFIDSDDKVTNNFLNGFNFNFDISIQGYRVENIVLKSSELIKYKEVEIYNDFKYYYCLNNISNVVWIKLFRTDIIHKHNIRFKKISLSEDVLFTLDFLNHSSTGHISDKIGYIYYIRDNNSLAHKKYSLDELMEKEKAVFGLYKEIFKEYRICRSFLHEMSLNILYKYYFAENFSFKVLKKTYLINLINYLNPFEKILLSISYQLFSKYAINRRRFKRKILRYVLKRFETTLLNV